ncbi:hypothetical protein [Candidatus Enterovibrio altilux]|uniref:Mobile element protein n=1 Tax=Candidatus Enterovibrio altilux TaxID=1927128 RepID=A0A291BBB2_9GAMM|nr:Mobile element protein [Candidatus Enterovibrio luxaltus]
MNDLAIMTAFIVKCVFSMSLLCPHYSRISKRTKTVNVTFKTKSKGTIHHLSLWIRGLRVYDDGE